MTTDLKKFLVFKLGDEEYGIDIQKIATIIEKDMSVTRVPGTPVFLKGVINLRGEIVPIIHLHTRFGLSGNEDTEKTRIVIVRFDEIIVGIIVDSIAEVIELNGESIENVTNFSGVFSAEYLYGVGKIEGRIITLLNLEKLVSLSENIG
ncbi:MAG: purine-binding chemotaxis protein CheW [Ruminiclostridium sp.]|nr:purine-binding chemotaxis protein CheW [Ruminiclostridium sp.]